MLNHILNDNSHKMKFAIIENEFGEVGVDEKVLSENVDEEVIEVMNGCICCTVRGDLVEALKKLCVLGCLCVKNCGGEGWFPLRSVLLPPPHAGMSSVSLAESMPYAVALCHAGTKRLRRLMG